MTRLRAGSLSVCSRVRGELAHIENGSQATPQGKRNHHNFVHDLMNPRNRLVSRYAVVKNSIRRRQWVQVCQDSGTDRCPSSPWRKCLMISFVTGISPKKHGKNGHSSNPSDSSPFKSLIWIAWPETNPRVDEKKCQFKDSGYMITHSIGRMSRGVGHHGPMPSSPLTDEMEG